MYKNLAIGSLLGFFAVVLGAFGAHLLKDKLSIDAMQSFETAVRYQMYHALLILFVNVFSAFSIKQKNILTALFFLGVLFFSGSIYLIQLMQVSAKTIWFVTPFGGLLLILGWLLLFFYFLKEVNSKK